MAMPQFVAAYFELGHVRLENGVARHVPEDAGVFAAPFQPGDNLGGANVFHKVRFVPTFAHALSLTEIIWRAAVAIRELKIEIVDEPEIPEDLKHERKARNCQEPRGLRAAVVMTVHDVKRTGKETAFAPLDFILARAFTENRVAIAAQTDEHLFEEILPRRQGFA